jgi:hypothetical protein
VVNGVDCLPDATQLFIDYSDTFISLCLYLLI